MPAANSARADVPTSRTERVQNFAEAMAQAILELGTDAGLDVHEMAAAMAPLTYRLAERISPPGLAGPLVRKIASDTWRCAPLPRAVPVGRTFGEVMALRIVSRLVADVEAAMKLHRDEATADPEILAQAYRLMGEAGFQRCRGCGCSEYDPCVQGNTPCHWIEDDLCSLCAGTNHPSAA